MRNLLNTALIFSLLLMGCEKESTSNVKITSAKPSLSKDQRQVWDSMIGTWYGNQPTKDGGRKEAISVNYQDGRYEIQFRITHPSGVVENQTEIGRWGVSGDIYFSIYEGWKDGDVVRPSDSSDPYNSDAYRIIELSNYKLEYEHVTTGNKYTMKKVPDGFTFPEL